MDLITFWKACLLGDILVGQILWTYQAQETRVIDADRTAPIGKHELDQTDIS